MTNKRTYDTFLTFSAIALCTVVAWAMPAKADSCDPVFNALTKVVTTPSHSYSTDTMSKGSQTTNAEMIYMQNKSYMRINGKWMENPETPGEILQQEQENRKRGKATCRLVRDESVNGEPAALYSLHSESENAAKEDAQMWISKRTGLPLREELDMDIGGSSGKIHLSTRYEYGNVKAPM